MSTTTLIGLFNSVLMDHVSIYTPQARLLLRLCISVLSTLSGPGGANLKILEATSGHILWELPLHDSSLGRLSEPVDVGIDISYAPNAEDVTVLSNSNTVHRVSILEGTTKWVWTAGDDV